MTNTRIPRTDYKAIFFDWDGTAVLNRRAPADEAARRMAAALDKGYKLIIISGTTWENLAGGALDRYFTPRQLSGLFLGLGRGAYNYGFDQNGALQVLSHRIPDTEEKLAIDRAAFALHQRLYQEWGIPTDIVFSRPNYCKIDLMVERNRGDALYLQDSEVAQLQALLDRHGFQGGMEALIALAEEMADSQGLSLRATTDAKYLELGLTTKSDNVDFFLSQVLASLGIAGGDCCFWGDEFRYICGHVPGSDAQMMTPLSREGDFFDVSGVQEALPPGVTGLGGKVDRFLQFLDTL